jgi:hypothetical protein
MVMGAMVMSGAARADEQSLIPRNVLFGNPDHSGVQISHDGKQISYRAAVDGVMNVWVAPVDNLAAAKAVTKDTKRGINQYFWAYTNNDILYLQDQGGDENWAVHRVNLTSGEDKTLTPDKDVNAQIEGVSEKFPEEILVNLNDRSPIFHDLHRFNITTGKDTLVLENPGLIDGSITAARRGEAPVALTETRTVYIAPRDSPRPGIQTITIAQLNGFAQETEMQPGTGVEDNVQGEGATSKQGVNETKPSNGAVNMGGASAGNAAGGTGVETSSQGEGSKNKTSN